MVSSLHSWDHETFDAYMKVEPDPCGFGLNSVLNLALPQDPTEIPESEFGEWPHVCMILKDEEFDIGRLISSSCKNIHRLLPEYFFEEKNIR